MQLFSRAFLACTLLLAVGACAVESSLQLPQPHAEPLASSAWWIPGNFPPGREPDGNTVIFRGNTGLVVMDTGRHRAHTQAILDFAYDQRLPVAAIINSHWHLDHTSGNALIKREYPRAPLYTGTAVERMIHDVWPQSDASEQALLDSGKLPPGLADDVRGDIATRSHPESFRADVPISQSGAQVIDGIPLELHIASNAATDGDVWVFDPRTRVVAAGDLVTLPVPFLDTACVRGWLESLSQIAATPFENVVPGHGAPMHRVQFNAYRSAFEDYIKCARSPADKSTCAAGWVNATIALRAPEPAQDLRAIQMAAAYVAMLRENGGNSRACAAS